MEKILFAKRNNMNIILLICITIVLIAVSIMYFLDYSFGLAGLNLTLFTAFTNDAMTAALGVFAFGVLAVVALWFSWNKFYTPVWLLTVFGVCYWLYNYLNNPSHSMFTDNIFVLVFCLLSILYYLWCRREHS